MTDIQVIAIIVGFVATLIILIDFKVKHNRLVDEVERLRQAIVYLNGEVDGLLLRVQLNECAGMVTQTEREEK